MQTTIPTNLSTVPIRVSALAKFKTQALSKSIVSPTCTQQSTHRRGIMYNTDFLLSNEKKGLRKTPTRQQQSSQKENQLNMFDTVQSLNMGSFNNHSNKKSFLELTPVLSQYRERVSEQNGVCLRYR